MQRLRRKLSLRIEAIFEELLLALGRLEPHDLVLAVQRVDDLHELGDAGGDSLRGRRRYFDPMFREQLGELRITGDLLQLGGDAPQHLERGIEAPIPAQADADGGGKRFSVLDGSDELLG